MPRLSDRGLSLLNWIELFAMYSDIKYEVVCQCGETKLVALSTAGTQMNCDSCGCMVKIPTFSELKGGRSIDVSPIGRLLDAIQSRRKPFDGNCQICDGSLAANIVPIRVFASTKQPGKQQEYEHDSKTIIIPCVLCDHCYPAFRRGLVLGKLQALPRMLLDAIWLLLALIAATALALVLPYVAVVFVFGLVGGLYYHLKKKSANPYLFKFLNRICNLGAVLRHAERFVFEVQKRQRIKA